MSCLGNCQKLPSSPTGCMTQPTSSNTLCESLARVRFAHIHADQDAPSVGSAYNRTAVLQSDTQTGAPYAPFMEGGLSYVDSAFQWGAPRHHANPHMPKPRRRTELVCPLCCTRERQSISMCAGLSGVQLGIICSTTRALP